MVYKKGVNNIMEESEIKRRKMISDIRKESMKETEIHHIFTVEFEIV